MEKLAWLGLCIAGDSADGRAGFISPDHAARRIFVAAIDEEGESVREGLACLRSIADAGPNSHEEPQPLLS